MLLDVPNLWCLFLHGMHEIDVANGNERCLIMGSRRVAIPLVGLKHLRSVIVLYDQNGRPWAVFFSFPST